MKTDTIAAIATGLSNAGISIIRISGDQALELTDQIFQSKRDSFHLSDALSHTIHYGYIIRDKEIIDEVLVSVMRGPNSYTREDVVEINCHGGIVVTRKILETILETGVRIAEPGEFTKRAFLNGRIDLSQAEAVIDIINAKNELALRNSVSQLKGNIQRAITDMRDQVIHEVAFIEAALDDPEHISIDGFADTLKEECERQISQLSKLIRSSDNGRMLREGIKTVILGKPNAGKSSLLNLLLGEERAIVTDIAGTTRDTLEESVLLNGISLNMIDTAGIRKTEDIVEKIGVSKAREMAKDADLIIYVVDSSIPLDENDFDILQSIQDKKALVLLNKSDLVSVISEEEIRRHTNQKVLKLSAKDGIGLEQLEQEITEMFFAGGLEYNDEVYITNARHKEALLQAKSSLEAVLDSIEAGMPEDFYSIDLMQAYQALGDILGESLDEDLINTIFREFCMGK